MSPATLCLLLAGGCAGKGEEDRAVAALNEVLASNRASLGTGGVTAPPTAPLAEPAAARAPDRPPEVAADRPRFGTAPAEARELLGRTPAELEARLGPPALRRTEGTAQVWLYLAPSCALDLVLYPVGGALTVAHAAARAAGVATEPVTQAQCLSALAAPRRRR